MELPEDVQETMEECQSTLLETIRRVETLLEHLRNAESCETPSDLAANLGDASDLAREVQKLTKGHAADARNVLLAVARHELRKAK